MMARRVGRPGLVGTMARTAVIAGTAQATTNAVNRRASARAQQQAEATAYPPKEDAAPPAPTPVDPAPAPAADDLVGRLTELGRLHQQGILTDEEFAAAKQQLLG